MENKVLELIEFLKSMGFITHLYKSNKDMNIFYYDITGFIDGRYFDLVLRESRYSGFQVIHAHTTKCIDDLEWLLKEFGITNQNQ